MPQNPQGQSGHKDRHARADHSPSGQEGRPIEESPEVDKDSERGEKHQERIPQRMALEAAEKTLHELFG